MDYTQIQYGTNGPIATITLDRPERLNAWTPRMSREKWHAIERANEDPAIGAIVLTGAGRGFCAGADVGGFQDQIEEQEELTVGGDWVELCRRSKPLIAAAPDELLPRTYELAHEIAGNPDPPLRMIKDLLTRNGSEPDLKAVQSRETELLRRCYESRRTAKRCARSWRDDSRASAEGVPGSLHPRQSEQLRKRRARQQNAVSRVVGSFPETGHVALRYDGPTCRLPSHPSAS